MGCFQQSKLNLVPVWIQMKSLHLRFSVFFFFRRADYVFSVGPMQCSQDSQVFYLVTFSLKLIYNTIYIFKNYFITVFLVFNFLFLTVSDQKNWKSGEHNVYAQALKESRWEGRFDWCDLWHQIILLSHKASLRR